MKLSYFPKWGFRLFHFYDNYSYIKVKPFEIAVVKIDEYQVFPKWIWYIIEWNTSIILTNQKVKEITEELQMNSPKTETRQSPKSSNLSPVGQLSFEKSFGCRKRQVKCEGKRLEP